MHPSRRLADLLAPALLASCASCGGSNAAVTPVTTPDPAPTHTPTAIVDASTARADPFTPPPPTTAGPPPPSPPPGAAAVTPAPRGLTAEQIRSVVLARRGALRACYEAEAPSDPSLRGGSVTVTWTVDAMGLVAAASVADSTVHNDAVERCLLRQVRAWRFPESDGDTLATFPFSFGAPAAGPGAEAVGDTTSVTGRLPPEAIHHVIKLNDGRFRGCYEDGLRSNPKLGGRVTVRFVIGRSGAVVSASDAGSTLPDAAVVACVVHAFGDLSFPQPEGGLVSVTYPFVFSPAN